MPSRSVRGRLQPRGTEGLAAVDRLLQAQAQLAADLVAHPDPERWGPEVAMSMMPRQPVIDGDIIPPRPIDGIRDGAGDCQPTNIGRHTEHRTHGWHSRPKWVDNRHIPQPACWQPDELTSCTIRAGDFEIWEGYAQTCSG